MAEVHRVGCQEADGRTEPGGMMRVIRWTCWVPGAAWLVIQSYVGRFEGWGQWAAAPLLLAPVAVSALFVGAGLLLASRRSGPRPRAADWMALGFAALPLVWIAARLFARVALPSWLAWAVLVVIGVLALDRVFLFLERSGRIYYRRTRGVRGGAMYHAQQLDSVFNPGMQHVQEAHVREEQEEDESGAPPAPDSEDAS